MASWYYSTAVLDDWFNTNVHKKVLIKKEPRFSNCKIIYTIGQEYFKEKIGHDFLKNSL